MSKETNTRTESILIVAGIIISFRETIKAICDGELCRANLVDLNADRRQALGEALSAYEKTRRAADYEIDSLIEREVPEEFIPIRLPTLDNLLMCSDVNIDVRPVNSEEELEEPEEKIHKDEVNNMHAHTHTLH